MHLWCHVFELILQWYRLFASCFFLFPQSYCHLLKWCLWSLDIFYFCYGANRPTNKKGGNRPLPSFPLFHVKNRWGKPVSVKKGNEWAHGGGSPFPPRLFAGLCCSTIFFLDLAIKKKIHVESRILSRFFPSFSSTRYRFGFVIDFFSSNFIIYRIDSILTFKVVTL